MFPFNLPFADVGIAFLVGFLTAVYCASFQMRKSGDTRSTAAIFWSILTMRYLWLSEYFEKRAKQ